MRRLLKSIIVYVGQPPSAVLRVKDPRLVP
jgi:hypothetical protein